MIFFFFALLVFFSVAKDILMMRKWKERKKMKRNSEKMLEICIYDLKIIVGKNYSFRSFWCFSSVQHFKQAPQQPYQLKTQQSTIN